MYEVCKIQPFGVKQDVLDVCVYSENGDIFYNHFTKDGTYNLPKGVHYIDADYIEITEPKKYQIKPLPKRQRFINKPKSIKIVSGNNPNKCSINKELGLIIYDRDFFSGINEIQKLFILSHELGHYYYSDEHLADLYAAHAMLKMGYNPSQIAKALTDTASHFANNRKELMIFENFE